MTIGCPFNVLFALIIVTVSCPLAATEAASNDSAEHATSTPSHSPKHRFVRLNEAGQPFTATANDADWPCVLDRHSGLIWEVKTRQAGLHQYERTYSWYQTDPQQNGGDPGKPGHTGCDARPCNTQALIQAVNQAGWCGGHDWRLPQREELRSLVDYRITYPGPMISRQYFPHTIAQFYWSATPHASNPREAWGIGFSFGFDYAYSKSDRVHVRLVRQAPADEGAVQ